MCSLFPNTEIYFETLLSLERMSQLNRTFRPLTAEELAFYDEPQPGDPDGLTSAYKVLVVQAPRFLHLPGTCNHLFCVYARYWVFLAIAHGDSASDWFHQACNPSCEYLPLPYSDSHSLSFHYGSPKIEITISSAATMASDLAWRILPGAKQRTTTKQESCSSGKHPLCSLMKGSDPLPKADENGFFWAVFTPIGTKFGTVIQKTRVNATYDFLEYVQQLHHVLQCHITNKTSPTLDRIIKPIGTGAIDDNE